MNETISSTFHGRDVFAPVAAYLAEGGPLEGVGPEVEAMPAPPGPVVGDRTIEGHVLIEDHFGNLITDISRRQLQALGDPSRIRVRVGAAFIQGVMQTFSDVAEGVALTYVGSGEHLEIAVNAGRASERLGLGVGSAVSVERRL
jgi:S-adenosylmethionine hydrolase